MEVVDDKPISSLLTSSCNGFDDLYDLQEEIGRGGFSIVYKCRQKRTGQIYAVKVSQRERERERERETKRERQSDGLLTSFR
jgi:serine/threonine protein kinase